MQIVQSQASQFLNISYRNGLYQGPFNRFHQQRCGYGLIFTTDNHLVMGTTWKQDKANEATFIFYNHSHYVYGFWEDSVPQGFNAVRMGAIVVFAWYEQGDFLGRLLVFYEQYNTAVVLERGRADGEFVEVQKGDVYSDTELNQYIKACQWPQFQQSWKTLIKFMTAYLVHSSGPKPERARLQLLNQTYYRYGFDDGIAIVFDDEYNIVSAGLHRKANLKSLGIRFTKENFVEEGNFDSQREVFAFNFGQRPENKIGKLYNNYLLKSVEFVNEFLGNPAKLLITYLEQLIKSNLFRKLLAGQITTRKLDLSIGSPETNKASSRKKPSGPQLQEYKSAKKEEELREIEEERQRLELYKKEIYDTISRRSRIKIQEDLPFDYDNKSLPIEEPPKTQIINKLPVQVKAKVSRKLQLQETRSKNRSPIFTPQKNQSRSLSPSHVSPFKQRMRSKIFAEQPDPKSKSQKRKYQYQAIADELYPKHSQTNIKNYNSPHEMLDFSRSRGNENEQVVPISVRKEKEREKEKEKEKEREEKNKERLRKAEIRDNVDNNLAVREVSQEKKKIRNIEKDPMISFRNSQETSQPRRTYTDIGAPNIVLSSPYKKRSPAHKKILNTPLQQDGSRSREKPYTMQTLHNRKNNIYLNQPTKLAEQPPSLGQHTKQTKVIKGNTYLQKYSKAKQASQEKSPDQYDSRKYNKTIKSFNQNNRIYEKIQSPPRPRKVEDKAGRGNLYEEMRSQGREREGREGRERDTREVSFNDTTPVKKKYQYVFE